MTGLHFLLSLFMFANPSHGADLRVGSKAPQLKIERWLRGEVIERFEPGRVYVIEFWATWCVPCLKAIPHLNEIATRYADVLTVIGVAGFENAESPEGKLSAVRDLLEKGTPSIEYAIAFDGNGSMAKAWMEAAGETGIPTSFVVDGSRQIAFVGRPWDLNAPERGHPLAQIVRGTWVTSDDRTDFESQQTTDRAERELRESLLERHFKAEAAADWPLVLANAREGKKLRSHRGDFEWIEAEVLIRHLARYEEGLIQVRKLVEDDRENPQALGNLLDLLLDERLPENLRDLGLAKKLADRIIALVTNNPDPLLTEKFMKFQWLLMPPVAKFYSVSGRPQLAVKFQEALLKTVRASDEDEFTKATALLEKYKTAASRVVGSKAETVFCNDGVCEINVEGSDCSSGLQ